MCDISHTRNVRYKCNLRCAINVVFLGNDHAGYLNKVIAQHTSATFSFVLPCTPSFKGNLYRIRNAAAKKS